MKVLSVLLLSVLPSVLGAKDYVFKVDEKLNSYVSDTISYEEGRLQVYQDAKTWLVDQKWKTTITYDSLGYGFQFSVLMNTKTRYNPIIRTAYADYVSFVGKITIEDNRLVVLFDNIQFGEAVSGFGQHTTSQPLSQKLHKLEKEKREKAKLESDETMDKKEKKKKLSKANDTIKDIEDSLGEVDEELRERITNLHNSI